MTYTLSISLLARMDLARLEAWLAQLNPAAALRAGQAIDAAIQGLETFPLRNALRENGLRHQLVRFGKRGYVIEYAVTDDEVRILRVWHGLEQRT